MPNKNNGWVRSGLFDHPTIVLLIIGGFSMIAALIFYWVGGSIAEVSGTENSFIGIGFKATGALGGFLLIFILSHRYLERLRESSPAPVSGGMNRIKLHLTGTPEKFSRNITTYKCKYWLFNEDDGTERPFEAVPRWEAGHLTVDVRNIGDNDLVRVNVENGNGTIWACDYFYSTARNMELVKQ